MVWPPTLTAASPVGATIAISSGIELPEAAQERRFSGAGAAGDEQVALALAHVVEPGLVLGRRRDTGRPIEGAGS